MEIDADKCDPSHGIAFSSGRGECGREGQDKEGQEAWLPVSCLLATLFSWPTSL